MKRRWRPAPRPTEGIVYAEARRVVRPVAEIEAGNATTTPAPYPARVNPRLLSAARTRPFLSHGITPPPIGVAGSRVAASRMSPSKTKCGGCDHEVLPGRKTGSPSELDLPEPVDPTPWPPSIDPPEPDDEPADDTTTGVLTDAGRFREK